MRKFFLVCFCFLLASLTWAQKSVEAEKMVMEGIKLHDKGSYAEAIDKYNKALELDKDNLFALTEKSLSLMVLKRYEESISVCEKALAVHAGHEELKTVYITYAYALECLNDKDKALNVYNEGIKLYPDFYRLHYNKGVTLAGMNRYEEAMVSFQNAVKVNPKHAQSHSIIARIAGSESMKIPSLLAFWRFFTLDIGSAVAKENFAFQQKLMYGDVKKEGNSITINVNSSILRDSTDGDKVMENDFASIELLMVMSSAVSYEKKGKLSDVEKFRNTLELVCSSLKKEKDTNHGFFWDYYAPYFIKMKDLGHIEAFAYVVYSISEDPKVTKWIKSNAEQVKKFISWSDSYSW